MLAFDTVERSTLKDSSAEFIPSEVEGPSARETQCVFSEVGWELVVRGPVGPFSLKTVRRTVFRALEPTPVPSLAAIAVKHIESTRSVRRTTPASHDKVRCSLRSPFVWLSAPRSKVPRLRALRALRSGRQNTVGTQPICHSERRAKPAVEGPSARKTHCVFSEVGWEPATTPVPSLSAATDNHIKSTRSVRRTITAKRHFGACDTR
jgi:hypothetical protein